MNRAALYAALAAGVVGAALLFVYKQRFESEVRGGAPVAVLMATREVPLGARLTEDALAIRYIPENYVEERHIRAADMAAVVGVRAGNAIRPNESVLWTDLATTTAQSRKLASLVRVGMRAVTIPVGDAVFGGLLRPGDRVDALLTAENSASASRQTAIIAQNLLVLAVGDDTGGEQGAGEARSAARGGSVTLAVSMEQGQRLILGATQGRMSLLLRNPDDLRTVDDAPETRVADVLNGARNDNAPAPAAPLSLAAAESLRDQAASLKNAETDVRAAKHSRSESRNQR